MCLFSIVTVQYKAQTTQYPSNPQQLNFDNTVMIPIQKCLTRLQN